MPVASVFKLPAQVARRLVSSVARSPVKAKALSRAITATTTKSSTKVKAPWPELSVAVCTGQTGAANRPAPATIGLPAATKRSAADRDVDKLGRLLIEVASTEGGVLPIGSLKSIRAKDYYLQASIPTQRGDLGGESRLPSFAKGRYGKSQEP